MNYMLNYLHRMFFYENMFKKTPTYPQELYLSITNSVSLTLIET